MEKVTKSKKSTKTKSKTPINPRVVQEIKEEKSYSFMIILWWIFKIITLPLYMVYLLLFKIPTDGPAYLVGLARFVFFMFIMSYSTEHFRAEHYMDNFALTHTWMSVSVSNTIQAFFALLILWNLFLSFMEIWGLSTGGYWYDPHENASQNSFSGYDAIEEGIDYRDSLLRAEHTPGKIRELKKTGFITKGRLSGLGSSPEVDEALVLLNSQMRAMHRPGKLKTLEGMFGGK